MGHFLPFSLWGATGMNERMTLILEYKTAYFMTSWVCTSQNSPQAG